MIWLPVETKVLQGTEKIVIHNLGGNSKVFVQERESFIPAFSIWHDVISIADLMPTVPAEYSTSPTTSMWPTGKQMLTCSRIIIVTVLPFTSICWPSTNLATPTHTPLSRQAFDVLEDLLSKSNSGGTTEPPWPHLMLTVAIDEAKAPQSCCSANPITSKPCIVSRVVCKSPSNGALWTSAQQADHEQI